MKVLSWLHWKLHPSVDYCHFPQKQDNVFHGAAEEDEAMRESTVERDTEVLLLNDVLLRGILAIGTLGHGLRVEENEFDDLVEEGEEKEGKEESFGATTLVVVASEQLDTIRTKSMKSEQKEEKVGDGTEEAAVLKAEQQEEDESKSEEKPLLMEIEEEKREGEKARVTLADLFAGDPFVVPGAGEKKQRHEQGKSSAGFSKVIIGCKEKEPHQKGKISSPASARRKFHGVMRRMLGKKIHPEQLGGRCSKEDRRQQPPESVLDKRQLMRCEVGMSI